MEGRLFRLDFSAAFENASHCGLLYKRRSIGFGEQFLSDRRQRVRLDSKVSVSVDVVF